MILSRCYYKRSIIYHFFSIMINYPHQRVNLNFKVSIGVGDENEKYIFRFFVPPLLIDLFEIL